jgi:hypothetical protein
MAEDIDKVRTRLRTRLEETARREEELGRDGFWALPTKLQNRLSALQQQSEPGGETLEAYLAADHNLETYNAVLDDALNLKAQVGGMESRLAAARRLRMRRVAVGGLAAAVIGGAGAGYYRSALGDKVAACKQAPACSEVGHCGARLVVEAGAVRLECAATSEEHCAGSKSCGRVAQCSLVDGACVATEADCRKSSRCRTDGWCSSVEGRCRAEKDSDCRKTEGCLERGECSPVGGVCKVASDADCRLSNLCREKEACLAVDNRCVAPDWGGDGGGEPGADAGAPKR